MFPGYENPLQRQPQDIGLVYYQHHELEVDYSVHIVYSLHTQLHVELNIPDDS